ncbi:NAD-dependent epimerase/dehydratase family protein [Neorhodopirellula pilleata]|uniref:3 beta-hydroxysteroid dehydrogenase/Delta 5-->4-isomerase n=1 Tax=Neorhodopirellula pilleata TaxID=2714738 RepID=A0A5C6AAZ6_9BACT|nr:NAD-dependent epimerase/dehydratase family protein [Neorhodopirellula pilleata]TWT96570.1 3 beta-hydroxysteroid dehydrogenase/Delta 5-->4-isomerase [Neorhodopirellula pilleata]
MSRGTVLITGATGMVGSLVAKEALRAGYTVRAMVRPTSDLSSLEGLDIETVHADLADLDSLPAAVSDVDYVINTAAHVGDWGPAEKFRAINVVALEAMLIAARKAGRIKRWVQISSLGVYAATHHYGTDETTPPDLTGLDGYTATKAEAEVLLNQTIRQHDFPATIIRPGFIYGPGDRHVVPRIIERLSEGQMKLIGDGQKKLNNTYAGNLVDAIMLAIDKDEAIGETFNIRDERLVTREEFVGAIADHMGLPMPKKVPEWLARSAVGFIEGFAKMRGAQTAPLLTNARIKFLTLNLDFSIDKAKRLLGYQPKTDFREGMKTALQWAQEHDLMPRRSTTSGSASDTSVEQKTA